MPTCSRILPQRIGVRAHFSQGVGLGVPVISTTVSAIARTPLTVTLTHRNKVNIVRGGVSVTRRTTRIHQIGHTRGNVVCSPIAVSGRGAINSTLGLVHRGGVNNVPIISSSGVLVNVIAGHSLQFRHSVVHHVRRIVAPNSQLVAARDARLSRTSRILLGDGVRGLPIISSGNRLIKLVACGSVAGIRSRPGTYGSTGNHLHITTNINVAPSTLRHIGTLITRSISTIILSSTRKRSVTVIHGLQRVGRICPSLRIVTNGITATRTTQFLVRGKTSNIGINVNPNSVYAAHVVTNINIPRLSTVFSTTSTTTKANIPIVTSNNLHCSNSLIGTLTTNNSYIVVNSVFTNARRTPNRAVVCGNHGFGSCHNVKSVSTVGTKSTSHCFRGKYRGGFDGLIPRNVTTHIPFGKALDRAICRLINNIHTNVFCYNTGSVRALRHTHFIHVASSNVRRDRPRSITVADRTPGCDDRH